MHAACKKTYISLFTRNYFISTVVDYSLNCCFGGSGIFAGCFKRKNTYCEVKMSGGCVFVAFQVNEKAVRVTAFLTMLAVSTFLIMRENWILYVLTVDFFIRAFIKPSYSPLAFISGIVLSVIHIKPVLINAGPKLFAAKIGFVFCLTMIVFETLNLPFWTDGVGLILLFCAALEAFTGFCVGCKLYSFFFIKGENQDYSI